MSKQYALRIALLFSILTTTIASTFSWPHLPQTELRWDWDSFAYPNINWSLFPRTFIWGTGDSALQTEGNVTVNGKVIENTWTAWEKKILSEGNHPDFKPMGAACERWTRYKEDIQLCKNLGMNTFRFSIDWSKIEPEKGKFDQDAMQHYVDFVDECLKNGLQPMPTLFHHAWPLWFEEIGGWEKAENITYFVEFAEYVFKHLNTKAIYWLTFNEPVGYDIEGYFRCKYPPAKKDGFIARLRRTGVAVKNMLDAHIEIYKAFKAINPNVKIGFAKVFNPIDPYHPYNPMEQAAVKFADTLLHTAALEYFKTGKYNWFYLITDENKDAPNSLDFIGLNYYTHALLKQKPNLGISMSVRPFEKRSMSVAGEGKISVLYAEGLYRSIERAAELGKPIIITENGFATDDVALRTEYIQKHLFAVAYALSQGYDIQGYLFWTLTDNFNWMTSFNKTHGLFAVDFKTQQRTLKPSAQSLIDAIASWKKVHVIA